MNPLTPGRVLVVGAGSAGLAHGRLLQSMGSHVSYVSRRCGVDQPRYVDVAEALGRVEPDLVVVADETSRHAFSIGELARQRYAGDLVIEKPLVANSRELLDATGFRRCIVAYQLRFHPAVVMLREKLAEDALVSAQLEAAHHLSAWRPGRKYEDIYSSHTDLGGGVLRDLSHELDLAHWLFGQFKRVAAIGGNLGVLGIAADETWSILAETARCPAVSICLNYLARPARRRIVVQSRTHAYEVDLIRNTFAVDGEITQLESSSMLCRSEMYRAFLAGDSHGCSIEEGKIVVRLVEVIEAAASQRAWVALQ